MEKRPRPSWDEYFLSFLPVISSRSTCDRGRSASILVKNKRIIATGYVGSIPGQPHCDDVGHKIAKKLNHDGTIRENCVRTVHSEQNVIAQCSRDGVSTENTTLYTTMEPCPICAALLIQCGIKKIIALKKYHDAQISREILAEAGVELIVIKDEEEKY